MGAEGKNEKMMSMKASTGTVAQHGAFFDENSDTLRFKKTKSILLWQFFLNLSD